MSIRPAAAPDREIHGRRPWEVTPLQEDRPVSDLKRPPMHRRRITSGRRQGAHRSIVRQPTAWLRPDLRRTAPGILLLLRQWSMQTRLRTPRRPVSAGRRSRTVGVDLKSGTSREATESRVVVTCVGTLRMVIVSAHIIMKP